MPKRKRGDFGDAGAAAHDGESREQRETQKKLQGVFDNGIARLLKALRVARGFEGQKLGKRRKLATDEKEKARLEAETAALEELPLNDVARYHLYKTLAKVKSIATSPSFPKDALAEGTRPNPFYETDRSMAKTNVMARLYSSNPVKAIMPTVIEKVKDIIGARIEGRSTEKADKRSRVGIKDATGVNKAEQVPAQSSRIPEKHFEEVRGSPSLSPEEYLRLADGGDEALSSTNEDMEAMDSESEELPACDETPPSASDPTEGGPDLDPDVLDQFESRLADTASEEEEEVEDKVKGAKSEHTEEDPWAAIRASAFEDAQARKTKAEEQRASSQEPKGAGIPKEDSPERDLNVTQNKTSKNRSTRSTFITSLSGYVSNSDSAGNTSDEEAAKIKPRKNKRGQQARRAIWEKKYGSNANHVKKGSSEPSRPAQDKKGLRPEKADPRRDRMTARDGYRGREQVKGPPVSTGANSVDVAGTGKDPAPPASVKVHPSWEAAKKQKEQKQGAAFRGKKMVFD